ncbi:hypothetical protein [Rubritalea tangerina]
MEDYNTLLLHEMNTLKQQGATTCAFGDIFLEDLKAFREKQMQQAQLQSSFPIWKQADTTTLAKTIIDAGIKAVLVCINGKFFDSTFLGREYDLDLLNDLPPGVDPCGENGEFHTFVYDAPHFSSPIPITLGAKVDKLYTPNSEESDEPECGATPAWDTTFHFQDLLLEN